MIKGKSISYICVFVCVVCVCVCVCILYVCVYIYIWCVCVYVYRDIYIFCLEDHSHLEMRTEGLPWWSGG